MATFANDCLELLLSAKVDDEKVEVSGGDFFVQSLVLDEGVGRIPTARLLLYSSTPGKWQSMARLKQLVGAEAGVRMMQMDDDGTVKAERWMSGVITAVEHLGVLYGSSEGQTNVCGYRMVIQPSLANLCHRHSSLHFADTSAEDVIAALTEATVSSSSMTDEQKSALSALRHFSQGEESDYEFFVRVLASCGLSYVYKMPAGEDLPAKPTLYIVGSSFPEDCISDCQTDGVAAENSLALGYKTQPATDVLGRMLVWQMSSSIGADACDISFGDAAAEDCSLTGHAEIVEKFKRVERFNHVPFDNLRKADEVKAAAANYLKALRRQSEVWMGVANRLEVRLGSVLTLKGFYGTDTDDISNMMVAYTRVRMEAQTPGGFVSADDMKGRSLYVSVGCIDGSDANADIASLPTGRLDERETYGGTEATANAGVERRVLAQSGTGVGLVTKIEPESDWANGGAASGDGGGSRSSVALVQATVCDSNGKSDLSNYRAGLNFRSTRASNGTATPDAKNSYEFYARPDAASDDHPVMVVRFVQPVGGRGQGLFRVPRLGERILVMSYSPNGSSVGGINYLMGYLPSGTMPVVSDWHDTGNAKPMDALTLRFDQTEPVKESTCRQTNEKCADQKNELSNLTDEERFDSTAAFRIDKKQNTFSELGFYDEHCSATRGRTADMHVLEFEYKDPKPRGALANLQSTGDVQVSANDRVEINGRNIRLGCPGWDTWRKTKSTGKDKADWEVADGKVEMDDISELVVRAKRRIVFEVCGGGSTIVLDRDGVCIGSWRWKAGQGLLPIESTLAVSGMRGVEINAQRFDLNALMGYRFADGAGASIMCDAGNVTTEAGVIRQKTMSKLGSALLGVGVSALSTLGNHLFFQSPLEFFGSGLEDLRTHWCFSNIGPLFTNFFGMISKNTDGETLTASRVSGVLKFICSLFDNLTTALRAFYGLHKWETPTGYDKGGNRVGFEVTYGDVFMLLALSAKMVTWLTVWALMCLKSCGSGRTATITLKTGGIDINAEDVNEFTLRTFEGHGPHAGKDVQDALNELSGGKSKGNGEKKMSDLVGDAPSKELLEQAMADAENNAARAKHAKKMGIKYGSDGLRVDAQRPRKSTDDTILSSQRDSESNIIKNDDLI